MNGATSVNDYFNVVVDCAKAAELGLEKQAAGQ